VTITEILAAIDAEITRLQQVRDLIAAVPAQKRPGRPAGYAATPAKAAKRRTLSATARKKIAAAQRKRWAAKRSAATRPAKKATGNRPVQKVTVTRLPPKQQRERKPRTVNKAPLKHALSSASGTVAVVPKAL
jgi:hypothetical protein